MRNKLSRNKPMIDLVIFDENGGYDLNSDLLEMISGGDIIVNQPRHGYVNFFCYIDISAPVDLTIDTYCGNSITNPTGINVPCSPSQPGYNAACFRNLSC